ncbi:MAG: DNA polymerase III subunit chi [Candidatus Micropelagos thuwalensis]
MTDVLFYHLERQSLEQALPILLDLSMQRNWRVVVQAGSPERVKTLDEHLWTYQDDSFMPHGASGDMAAEDAATQPIWLTDSAETPNDAQVLFLVDGADRDEIKQFERCIYMFDGGDDEAVRQARDKWKSLSDEDYSLTYYQQNHAGKWEKKG